MHLPSEGYAQPALLALSLARLDLARRQRQGLVLVHEQDLGRRAEGLIHAKNKIVARCIPFSVLRFWVKSTGIFAGVMPYRRDFTATTRI